MATALWTFLREKYGITETLDFRTPSANPGFDLNKKRQTVSKITELVEQAKRALVEPPPADAPFDGWTLPDEAEEHLRVSLAPVIQQPNDLAGEPHQVLSLSLPVLQKWIEADVGSARTRGEPGFIDVFFYLQELAQTLAASKRPPHLVILSGRTTRLPFIKRLAAHYLRMPLHRIRTLGEMLPDALKGPDHENIDKLAVVYGAHRFRFGTPIHFRYQTRAEDDVFHRFIGTVSETPQGLRLNRILVKPGDTAPRTCKLKLAPTATIRLGHAFRSDGRVEVLASVNNTNPQEKEVEFDLKDDYRIEKKPTPQPDGVYINEWVPGGTTDIVDNFNDTGRIDCEPEGFLRSIVVQNRDEWIKGR
jgi:hypothetical protein